MYGCPQHFYRGACANSLRVRQDYLEQQLLSELQAAVLCPEAIDYILQEFHRQMEAAGADASQERQRAQQKKQELTEQLQRLTAAVAEGGHSSALLQAIAQREGDLAEVERLLAPACRGTTQDPEELRHFTLERLSTLPELLSLDVPRARAELSRHITQVSLTPPETDGRRHFLCQGEWNLLGAANGGDVRMVAGPCNQPTS